MKAEHLRTRTCLGCKVSDHVCYAPRKIRRKSSLLLSPSGVCDKLAVVNLVARESTSCWESRYSRVSCNTAARPPQQTRVKSEDESEQVASFKDFTLQELEQYCESIDEPKKRAKHIWTHLYGDKLLVPTFPSDSSFSKDFLSKVEGKVKLDAGLELIHTRASGDGTKKLIFQRQTERDLNMNIETVLIPVDSEGRKRRLTVCVSSQIGCAMGCKFCYTGLMGLQSNLSAGEIVEQVIAAKRIQRDSIPVSNIVFMGMGEPFHNLDSVLKAIQILTTPSSGYTHFSERKITVSTVGLIPEIRRFTLETNAQLALSLHATTEESRSLIVPTNNKYSLAELIACLEELYPKGRTKGSHGRHVLIEYVMLQGVNDTMDDAKRLVTLLEKIECKVNLIVFNSFDGSPFLPSEMPDVRNFRNHLVGNKLVCTIRCSRGDDEMAACGQLGFKVKKRKS